jgi:hypothetical protein
MPARPEVHIDLASSRLDDGVAQNITAWQNQLGLITQQGIIDAHGFGTDPTGVLDSAPAFQAALNAARATNQGYSVYVRPGNYLLNSLNCGAALTGTNFACFGVDYSDMQTTTTAAFTLPGNNNNVTVSVASTALMLVGSNWFIVGVNAAMVIISINSATSVTLQQQSVQSATIGSGAVVQNASAMVAPSFVGVPDNYGSLYPAAGNGATVEQTYNVQFNPGSALNGQNQAWMMYWGSGPQFAIGGYSIGGFLVNQYSPSGFGPGGVLLQNGCGAYNVRRLMVRGNTVAPVPPTPLTSIWAAGITTPTGHISCVAFTNQSNYTWNGQLSNIYSNNSGMDGICANEGGNSRTVISDCEAHNAVRYGMLLGNRARGYRLYASGANVANYYIDRSWLIDCDSQNAGATAAGNEVIVNNTGTDGTGSPPQKALIMGGTLKGTNENGSGTTEANSSIIYVESNKSGVVITGVGLLCGSATSEPIYLDNGCTLTDPVIASGNLVDLSSSSWLNSATGANTCPSGIRLPTGFTLIKADGNVGFGIPAASRGRLLLLSANAAAPAINTDAYDAVDITAQTATITGFTLTGQPQEGDKLIISITGTASVPITWGTSFESSGTQTLPTTTVGTTRLDVAFRYNTATSKWRMMGSS